MRPTRYDGGSPLIVPAVTRVAASRIIYVDGVRTHYLEAGDGPPLVLLHSGEFGGSAEFSWEYLIPDLAREFRVIAPDWLGFGRTAKLHDFEGKRARMIFHLLRFLEVLGIASADFIGNSMGATFLLQLAAERPRRLPARRIVAIGGGGFVPENDFRKRMVDYDGTPDGMVRILEAMFHTPVWYSDIAYLQRRHHASMAPGAWEAVAAARLQPPDRPPRSEFGQPDKTEYGNIDVATLVIAGAEDKLRLPGYAQELASRIPRCDLAVLPDVGHCANIEKPREVHELITAFLASAA